MSRLDNQTMTPDQARVKPKQTMVEMSVERKLLGNRPQVRGNLRAGLSHFFNRPSGIAGF
jgi:hypothetical protein